MINFKMADKNNISKRPIPYDHLFDNYMSFRAKGILSILYMLNNESEISPKDLATITSDSSGMIYSALKELQHLGYIKRKMTRDECGRFTGAEYFVLPHPAPRTVECGGPAKRKEKHGSIQG